MYFPPGAIDLGFMRWGAEAAQTVFSRLSDVHVDDVFKRIHKLKREKT
jgi:hypothetical protein